MENEEPQNGKTKATVEVHDWRLQKLEEGQEKQLGLLEELKEIVQTNHASLPCNVREEQSKTLRKDVKELGDRVSKLENSKINWKNVAIFAGTLASALGLDKIAEFFGVAPKP